MQSVRGPARNMGASDVGDTATLASQIAPPPHMLRVSTPDIQPPYKAVTRSRFCRKGDNSACDCGLPTSQPPKYSRGGSRRRPAATGPVPPPPLPRVLIRRITSRWAARQTSRYKHAGYGVDFSRLRIADSTLTHLKQSKMPAEKETVAFEPKGMLYRNLGDSGLRVPVFSYGGWLT